MIKKGVVGMSFFKKTAIVAFSLTLLISVIWFQGCGMIYYSPDKEIEMVRPFVKLLLSALETGDRAGFRELFVEEVSVKTVYMDFENDMFDTFSGKSLSIIKILNDGTSERISNKEDNYKLAFFRVEISTNSDKQSIAIQFYIEHDDPNKKNKINAMELYSND